MFLKNIVYLICNLGKNVAKKNISMRYNPREPEDLDQIIRSSYDDFVRMERRNLLIVSSIIIFSFFAGINPEKASFLGFSFPKMNEIILFSILLTLCIYFFIAYVVYALPGFRSARKGWEEIIGKAMKISGTTHRCQIELKNYISNSRYYIWLTFNYILPLVLGLIAIGMAVVKVV